MGSLNFNYIKTPDVTKQGYLYSDLKLDLENDYKIRGNSPKEKTKLIDIKVSYDEFAIKNSIISLLSTNPGERLLLPEYGVNLKRYIFSPISEVNAHAIGNEIKYAIEQWEPRVIVDRITINPNIDAQTYYIGLGLYIPSLGKMVPYQASLIQGEGVSF